MRLVLDTNAAVSGLLWHGNPGKLIDAAQAGSLILCASAPLLAELHGVLGRQKFATHLQIRGLTATQIFEGYAALTTVVVPAIIPSVIIDDPDDDAVLACAVAAKADLVVSGDPHLAKLVQYEGIPIVAPVKRWSVLACDAARLRHRRRRGLRRPPARTRPAPEDPRNRRARDPRNRVDVIGMNERLLAKDPPGWSAKELLDELLTRTVRIVALLAAGVDGNGNRCEEKPQRFRPNGVAYPVDGFPGLTSVTTRPDRNTIRAEAKREDNSLAGEGTYAVADDGQTMTATTKGLDSQLRPFTMATVWDRG